MVKSYKQETCIFDIYKYNLGMKKINSYRNINVYYMVNEDETWKVLSPLSSSLNESDFFKYYDNNQYLIKTNRILKETEITSIDSNTLEPSEYTKEQLYNIPLKQQMTSADKNQITETQEYQIMTKTTDENLKTLCKEYLESLYPSLSSNDYNSLDYLNYDIDETPLIDNKITLTAESTVVSGKDNSIYNASFKGVLLTIKNNDYKEIPMTMYKFPNIYYINNNYLKLDWDLEGIVTLE